MDEEGNLTGESEVAEVGSVVVTKPHKKNNAIRHGLIMWISWTIFGFIQIGTLRWFGEYWRYNQIIHSLSGWFIVIMTLISGLAAFKSEKNRVVKHPH